MSESFEFQVQKFTHDWDENLYDPPRWIVTLPHQCDAWSISGGDRLDPNGYDDAVAALEQFIAEAHEALAALKEGRELNAEDEDW